MTTTGDIMDNLLHALWLEYGYWRYLTNTSSHDCQFHRQRFTETLGFRNRDWWRL